MYQSKSEKYSLNNNSVQIENVKGYREELLIEAVGEDSFEIKVTGAISDGGTRHAISLVDMRSFEMAKSITQNGIYALPSRGLMQCELVATGTVDVTVKLLSDRG